VQITNALPNLIEQADGLQVGVPGFRGEFLTVYVPITKQASLFDEVDVSNLSRSVQINPQVLRPTLRYARVEQFSLI
jgi:hypothetical protein